jgi:hypothetical protein
MHLCCVPALRHPFRHSPSLFCRFSYFLVFLRHQLTNAVFAPNSRYFGLGFRLVLMDLVRDRVQDHLARRIKRLGAPVALRGRVTTFI